MTLISDVLSKKNISTDLKGRDKETIIKSLLSFAMRTGGVEDREEAYKAIMDRERLMSTALENGIAIPHGKTNAVSYLIMSLGISKSGIDFHSMDGKPTYIFFLILVPEKNGNQCLRMMAQIANLTRNSDLISLLRKTSSSTEVLKIIRSVEKIYDSI